MARHGETASVTIETAIVSRKTASRNGRDKPKPLRPQGDSQGNEAEWGGDTA